jgi:CHAT domain-containing protein
MIDFLIVKNHSNKNLFFKYKWLRVYFIFFLSLISITVSYSQNSESEREISEAIENAKNGKCEQAISILKKYSNKKEFDELRLFEINFYLNLCHLKKGDGVSYLGLINNDVDNYIKKNNISRAYQLKSAVEIDLILDAGKINKENKNFNKSIIYLSLLKDIYEENEYINPTYLDVLFLLLDLFLELSEFESAAFIGELALNTNKIINGEINEFNLNILQGIELAYNKSFKFFKSLEYQEKITDFKKNKFGIKSSEYLYSLISLSNAYTQIGDFEKALEFNLFIFESIRDHYGESDPYYLTSLSNLSVSYFLVGNYTKALELNLETVEKKFLILGDRNPDYLKSLEDLGNVYSNLGDDPRALEIHLKVVEIKNEVFGENHQDYLSSLFNLASTYSKLGKYEISLDINKNVFNSLKDSLGEQHPFLLAVLNNLAYNYSKLGFFDKSLELNEQILKIRKELYGEYHPDYITSLANLSLDFFNLKQSQNSLRISNKVKDLSKEVFGQYHPKYLLSLGNLAGSEFDNLEFEFAINHYLEMLSKSKEKTIMFFHTMNEQQREVFWKQNQFSGSFDFFPMFLQSAQQFDSERVGNAYDFSLFTKGLLLNTTLDFNRLFEENGTSEAIEKYEDFKRLKLQIQRINDKPLAGRNLNVDSLESLALVLETDLVKLSKEYGDYTRNLKITWEEVQSNLGEKDVAIEFLEYPTLTDTVKYAALVLRRGWENPKFVPLFRKDQIDGIFKQGPNQIYSYDSIGKELKKLVWDPLEELIALGDKVHFSAAGIFHQLAIENLSYDESTTLGDRYQMYRLSSTKELAFNKPKSKNQNVALYGGIKYDLCLEQMIASSEKYERKDSFLAVRGIQQDSLNRKGKEYLPGTLAEVNEIGKILKEKQYQVTEFIGESGSEESLKDLSGKRTGIIHIATHGFFLPVEQSKRNPFIQKRFDDRNDKAGNINPMLRSGLLLAGGNRAWQGDSIPDMIEDGVLTAKEISNLDLRETDLVVLSACETGLGDVSSEGVFGLQRAFKQAGVQTIIMSLWNVKDEATKYLMTNFYSYLTQGASKREAFIQARNKCREMYQDPESWAAFIMLD